MIKIDKALFSEKSNMISSDGYSDSTDSDIIRIRVGKKCTQCDKGQLQSIGGGGDGGPQGSTYSFHDYKCDNCNVIFRFEEKYLGAGNYKTVEFSFKSIGD